MLLVHHQDTYPAERAYALDVVLGDFLGLQWEARPWAEGHVEITCPDLNHSSLRVNDGLFAMPQSDWLTARSLPKRPLLQWDLSGVPLGPVLVSAAVPILYGDKLEHGSFFAPTDRGIRLGIDLFGSIFLLLSRYEEIANPARDEHDRFPATASLAHQEGFLDRPLVNEYVEILKAAIARLWPGLRPRRRAFTERLSHDVDWPVHDRSSVPRVVKAIVGDAVRRHDPGLAGARVRALFAQWREDPSTDPYNTFDFIMDLSEEHGVRSAFYFMAGRTDSRFDGAYSLEEPWIGALIRRIHERGHEIGLHPSYGTFRDPAAVRAERDALAESCERLGFELHSIGGRQHFLRWENPTTWRAWEQAGLAYDSSLGYSRDPGFRCSVCFEYPVFDLLARQPLGLRERPLVLMEMALLDRGPASDSASLETIAVLRERCRMFGGDFTLLWHNSRLASRRERRMYAAAVSGNQKPPS